MNYKQLELGAVLQLTWDTGPLRVLAFDRLEVMYDVWWPHKKSWGLTLLTGTATYYRISTQFLLEKAEYLRTDSYTDSEYKTHRPDLPLRLAQSSDFSWQKNCHLSIDEFVAFFPEAGSHVVLNTPEIYLSPFGPNGHSKRGVLVESKNKDGFSLPELLWHAEKLQAPLLGDHSITNGVGIYRHGIQRQVPSYYMGLTCPGLFVPVET